MFTDFFEKVEKIYNKLKNTNGGKNVDYIPELAKVNPHLYAISIYTINGEQFNIGDFEHEFAIESCSKIFSLALALNKYGKKTIENKLTQSIQRIRNAAPHASIIIVGMQDSYLNNSNIENAYHYSNFIKEFCKNKDIAFYDYFTVAGGRYAMKKWNDSGLAQNDLIHLMFYPFHQI
jgi:hypothetical protein